MFVVERVEAAPAEEAAVESEAEAVAVPPFVDEDAISTSKHYVNDINEESIGSAECFPIEGYRKMI